MRRRALVGALLLTGVGVVLGATVFRTDIAQATGLAQSVTVVNTATNPVPVRQRATTQLLATGMLNGGNPSLPDIVVSGYKKIRISFSVIACVPGNGTGTVVIAAKEGGNEYSLDAVNLCQTFPTGFTAVYEVPGRTLGIRCANCVNTAAGLAVWGRPS